MEIKTIKTTIFRPRQDLLIFLEKYFRRISSGSVLVITSKIVALSEGRLVHPANARVKENIIYQESEFVLPTKYVHLTIKEGMVMATAGIDESNGHGDLILLPRDSFKTAAKIRRHFLRKYRLKNLGVIITDSRTAPLRAGVTGVALGYAGFRGLKDYRGQLDIFGRPFHFSRVDIADSLATAAVLGMGEGRERRPLAIINRAPIEYCAQVNRNELKISLKDDMYGPLFRKLR